VGKRNMEPTEGINEPPPFVARIIGHVRAGFRGGEIDSDVNACVLFPSRSGSRPFHGSWGCGGKHGQIELWDVGCGVWGVVCG
jgi:hypothetical protein